MHLVRIVNKKKHEELLFQAQLAGKELKESAENKEEVSQKTKDYAEIVRKRIAERGKVNG